MMRAPSHRMMMPTMRRTFRKMNALARRIIPPRATTAMRIRSAGMRALTSVYVAPTTAPALEKTRSKTSSQ